MKQLFFHDPTIERLGAMWIDLGKGRSTKFTVVVIEDNVNRVFCFVEIVNIMLHKSDLHFLHDNTLENIR